MGSKFFPVRVDPTEEGAKTENGRIASPESVPINFTVTKWSHNFPLLYSFQQQVEQMREMGITDENVARQALMATNGDMQAAINLIFSGDL